MLVAFDGPQYRPDSADDAASPPGQAIGAIAKGTSSVRGRERRRKPTTSPNRKSGAGWTRSGVGLWLSVIVCVGGAAYALHTWSGPHRDLDPSPRPSSASSVSPCYPRAARGAVSSGAAMRTSSSSHGRPATSCWSQTIAGLDGGSTSPYILLLVLPFLFAALSLLSAGDRGGGLHGPGRPVRARLRRRGRPAARRLRPVADGLRRPDGNLGGPQPGEAAQRPSARRPLRELAARRPAAS